MASKWKPTITTYDENKDREGILNKVMLFGTTQNQQNCKNWADVNNWALKISTER